VAEAIELFPRDMWTPFASLSRHDNWNTTQWITDLVLALWPEGIDTDPCTNASSIVPARVRYDCSAPELDGLKMLWQGRCYVNPPYSDPAPWYERAALHALRGREVLLLVNVTTTTRAWRRYRPVQHLVMANRWPFSERASAVAFFDKRIAFLDAGVPIKSNEYEQMALYWGPCSAGFREVFGEVAWCP
jgi:hypothetical protein